MLIDIFTAEVWTDACKQAYNKYFEGAKTKDEIATRMPPILADLEAMEKSDDC